MLELSLYLLKCSYYDLASYIITHIIIFVTLTYNYVAILHMFYTLIHEVACFQRHTSVAISNAGCFAYMQCIIGVLFCGPFFPCV